MYACAVESSSTRWLRTVGVLTLVGLMGLGIGWFTQSENASSQHPTIETEHEHTLPDDAPPTIVTAPHLEGSGSGAAARGGTDSSRRSNRPDEPTTGASSWKLTFACYDTDGEPHPWTSAILYDGEGKALKAVHHEGDPTHEGSIEVPGEAYLVVEAWKSAPWRSEWLTPPASGERHCRVTLGDGLTLAGIVYQQDGRTPLHSGTVRVWSLPSEDEWRPGVAARMAVVGKDGRFAVEGLPGGPLRVVAEAHDFTLGRKITVQGEAGEQDLRVVLGPQGAIALLITDAETGLELDTKQGRILRVTDEGEQAWSFWGRPPGAELKEATRTSWYRAEPGSTHRFRVRAHGYAPSEVIEVLVPPTGGVQEVPVSLRPAPETIAKLRIVARVAEGPIPDRIFIVQHLGSGSASFRGVQLSESEHLMELMPGAHHLEVGRAFRPDLEDPSTFFVPVEVKVDLKEGESQRVEVTLERGGWVLIEGRPDPRPRLVRLTRGSESLERYAHWGSRGKGNDTAYLLGALAPGTWTLEYARRERGVRTTFEVKRGEVTRLQPVTFETFDAAED